MDNKIEEPIFTFESIVIQQVQGIQSGRCNQDLIESFNELAAYYAQMAIKDLDLNQIHHPLLNACRSLASTLHSEQVTWHSTQLRLIQLFERFPRLKPFLIALNKYGLHLKDILSGEKTGLDIFVGDEEIAQTFQQVKTLLSAIKTQQIFHSICQHLQLQYERQTKDDNSFENYRLRIFWLTDSDCSDVLPILDLLLNLSPQTGLLIDLHYADSDPIQLANAQQTFNTHINNQTKNFSIIYDETIDLYDSKTLEKIPFESFDIIFSSNLPLGNQDLTNSLIDLRRLLELVHIPLYFDLNFGFIDQWWSSDNVDKNNRVLNNIQQRTALLEQIEGFNFIESTLNENENTLIIIYVLINNAQFNNDSNLNIIPSRFIGFERIVLRLNHTNHNQVQHLILHYGMLQNNNEQKKSKLEHISIIPKREVDQKLFRPCISPSRFLSPLTWIEEDREEELLPSDMVD
ncbi:unnamed protein product [Adineta steineri]|uniref:Uncharacterized protein n=1 Tax=Adineta steineri TaxID=433720 RepID=A0A819CFA3_9BILA|nr:unnamed protein product [Adineta steineri]